MADTRVDVERKPAPLLTCGGCSSTWSGLGRAHCGVGGCHRTFTGVTAFDRHRGAKGECLDPATLGMVLREGGLWGAPALTPEQAAEIWKKEPSDG